MLMMTIACALVLAALFVFVRIARKGRGQNYEKSKKVFEERLQKTRAQTREHILSAGMREQMLPIAAAIRELLDLAGNPPGFALLEEVGIVRLQSPAGEIRVAFGLFRMRAAPKRKPGQPQGCWLVSGPGAEQKKYTELADVVIHLQRIILGR